MLHHSAIHTRALLDRLYCLPPCPCTACRSHVDVLLLARTALGSALPHTRRRISLSSLAGECCWVCCAAGWGMDTAVQLPGAAAQYSCLHLPALGRICACADTCTASSGRLIPTATLLLSLLQPYCPARPVLRYREGAGPRPRQVGAVQQLGRAAAAAGPAAVCGSRRARSCGSPQRARAEEGRAGLAFLGVALFRWGGGEGRRRVGLEVDSQLVYDMSVLQLSAL